RGSGSMPELWRPEIAAILSPDLRECRTRSTGELRRRGRPSVDRQPLFQWLEFGLASYQRPDDDSGQRESYYNCCDKPSRGAATGRRHASRLDYARRRFPKDDRPYSLLHSLRSWPLGSYATGTGPGF